MPIPVVTVSQMREWEQATWATGQTPDAVIRRVGERLAQRARDLTRDGDRILILAGRGHNGDDARCAQPHLGGRRVELIDIPDAAAARAGLTAALDPGPALVIDGLFGIGLNRPLDPAWTNLIATLNAARVPVLAVDVPSGLNADTGDPFGTVVQAAVTVTLGAPKAGLLRPSAWASVGRLEVEADIGLTACPCHSDLQWTMPGDFVGYPPPRPAAAHKGSFGHVAILAGSEGYHGAAVLAARGAQRAQPGLITLCTAPPVYTPVASQLQAVMVQPWRRAPRWPDTVSAVLCGPGLASPDVPADLRDAVVQLWHEADHPVIIDASALDWLPSESAPTNAVRVITPHPGEAARMLGITAAAVQQDRPTALRALSHRFGGCWVVLKGHQTLTGRQEGPVFVNSTGNPRLAQGGSGDLLAGYLAGLLAQPALQTDPVQAARYAVWQHGAAADHLSRTQPNWVVEDLPALMGAEELGA
jgi:NAD(P)H-hydrate epimerase